MTDVAVTVQEPAESAALAAGVQKLFLDLVAAKKAGLTGVGLLTAGVTAAIGDLEAPLAGLAGLDGEVKPEPVGVAQAFANAGFGIARALTGK